MSKLITVLLALTMAVAVSCSSGGGGDNESPSAEPAATNEIDVGLQEYAFNISGEAHPGELTINYTNDGKELHMGIVGRLDQGKTLQDIIAEIQKGQQGPPPPWYHEGAAPNLSLLSPGDSTSMTFDATQSGTYVMLCFVPAPNGKPHAQLGMVNTFDVSGGKVETQPQTDGTISVSTDGVQVPKLSSGASTVEITNTSDTDAPNGFNLVKLAPGKSLDDLNAWFNSFKGAPPADFLGGVSSLGAGQSSVMTFNLTPGTYTAIAGFKGVPPSQEFTVT